MEKNNSNDREKMVVDILLTSIHSLKLTNEEVFTIALGFLTQVMSKMNLDNEGIEKVCKFIRVSLNH